MSEDLTVEEMQSHFALWAIVKSPLFISADLRSVFAQVYPSIGTDH